ncbi:WD40 repeat domain-containing protein [Thalassotalea ganghwensis]
MNREKSINRLEFSKHAFRPLIWAVFALTSIACQPVAEQPIQRWQHAGEAAYAADISYDAKYSVVSSVHHGINLWDLESNTLKYNWSQQQDDADNLVLALDIAYDNSHVLAASRSNFSIWSIESGEAIGFWKISDSTIRDVALANNANSLLLGQADGKVIHLSPKTGRRLEFLGHSEKVNSVDLLPNGRIALSGGNDFIAYVWDTQTGQVIYRFNHPSRVTYVAIDSKGRFAFTADSKKSANIWSLKTGELISQLHFSNRQEVFSAVTFSDDGLFVATGAPSRKVSIWDLHTGKRLRSWRVTPKKGTRPAGAVVYAIAFSDNAHIITESSSGYAELWPISQ